MSQGRSFFPFITNLVDDPVNLADHIKEVGGGLLPVERLDILVAYFYLGGYLKLCGGLKTDKIRILVGLRSDIGRKIRQEREAYHNVTSQDPNPDRDSDYSFRQFQKDLADGKIDIRRTHKPSHAKLYFFKYSEKNNKIHHGHAIIGSSNLSKRGLVSQIECNVALREPVYTQPAEEFFNRLWELSVDLKDEVGDVIKQCLRLTDPYKLYLKMLYERFKDRLEGDEGKVVDLPKEGIEDYKYQALGARNVLSMLNRCDVAFLSDVVGLGKTITTLRVLKRLKERALICCPRPLVSTWKEMVNRFDINARVFSMSTLNVRLSEDQEEAKRELEKRIEIENFGYEYLVIDESHNFRHKGTDRYKRMAWLAKGKKLILLSATPINKEIDDIYHQMDLSFQGKAFKLTELQDLNQFFTSLRGKEKMDQEDATTDLREQLLRHIMVRRTREDIKRAYEDGDELSFPQTPQAEEIEYDMSDNMRHGFKQALDVLGRSEEHGIEEHGIKYAIYTPRKYTRKYRDKGPQYEINLEGLMKTCFVKRLESSVFAFKETLGRLVTKHEDELELVEKIARGEVHPGEAPKVDTKEEFIEEDDTDLSVKLKEIDSEKKEKESKEDILRGMSNEDRAEYKEAVEGDLTKLRGLKKTWDRLSKDDDPKRKEIVEKVKHILHEKPKEEKILIFTESKDTSEDIYLSMKEAGIECILYHSGKSTKDERQVEKYFDPSYEPKPDDIHKKRVLVCTDALAAGVNLHLANHVINYDLPWTPLRLIQRNGRVNRIGTKHKTVYRYCFLPSEEGDAKLTLLDRVVGRLDTLHQAIGTDQKEMEREDDRNIISRGLFDAEQDIDKPASGLDSGEEQFLTKIYDVEKEDPTLFKEIKDMPLHLRTMRPYGTAHVEKERGVLTFFRRGNFEKFCFADSANPAKEYFFVEAAIRMQCEQEEFEGNLDRPLPDVFFEGLKKNKKLFKEELRKHENPKQELIVGEQREENKQDQPEKKIILSVYFNKP
ncbi:MAG: helicase-related protein [Cytophagales bacterium]|nr:helicase-related protein [Cytophagales bacterium]